MPEPIKFISGSAQPGKRDWDGLRLISEKSQQESVLQYVEVSGAEDGIALYDAPVNIMNLTARYCENGVSMHGASGTTLIGITAFDCDTGFFSENTWNCQLSKLKVEGGTNSVIMRGDSNFNLTSFDLRGASNIGMQF